MSISEVESRTLQNNSQQSTYKCYLRLPNMKAVVYNISMTETLQGLKQIAKKVFGFNNLQSQEEVKLIVNGVQLEEGMNLSLQLFDNAIIHVIVSQKRSSKSVQSEQQAYEEQQQTLTLRIKQPPVKCPVMTLPWIPLRLAIKSLKSRILQFYRRQYFDEKISKLDEDELYLVYGGRVLMDEKTLEDYDVTEDGVMYVVNGREYVRVVTREQGQRRINQIKGRVKGISQRQQVSNQILETNKQPQIKSNQQPLIEQHPQFPQQQYEKQQQLQQYQYQSSQSQKPETQIEQSEVLNIIHSIVHDEDSQDEGEDPNHVNQPQKFIRRYDSKTGNVIESDNDSKDIDEFLMTKNDNNLIDAPEEQLFKQEHEEQFTQQGHLEQSMPNLQQVEITANHSTDENNIDY